MIGDKKQILVADDEPNLRLVLRAQLEREGYEVQLVADGEEALRWLKDNHVDLLITDLKMPKVDGMALMQSALVADEHLPVVMITAHGTVDNAVQALKLGAFDYLQKPFEQTELLAVARKALKTRELAARDASRTEAATDSRFGLIGQSDPILQLYSLIEKVADSPTSVLLNGESGTGKELVARAIHSSSSRAAKPFIKVNCAAIPKDLIESEFFGHEKGAFTGALSSKPGRFELAHGGTLFLDEISAVPVAMQVKLLRALQEGEFERLGGVKTHEVDVRVIAATNANLKTKLETGEFREDLYYRLNVVEVTLPALRERKSDIPLLVQHFIHKYNERLGKSIAGLSSDALALFGAHGWPGNVRELENVLERAVLFAEADTILPEHLPDELSGARGPETRREAISVGLKQQVKAAVNQLERRLIARALEQMNSNVTHTARLLQLSRKGLQLKMKELGLRETHESKGREDSEANDCLESQEEQKEK